MNKNDTVGVMTFDTLLAITYAKTCNSSSGAFKTAAKVQAANSAVRAGVVFG